MSKMARAAQETQKRLDETAFAAMMGDPVAERLWAARFGAVVVRDSGPMFPVAPEDGAK